MPHKPLITVELALRDGRFLVTLAMLGGASSTVDLNARDLDAAMEQFTFEIPRALHAAVLARGVP